MLLHDQSTLNMLRRCTAATALSRLWHQTRYASNGAPCDALSESELQLQQAVRQFAATELKPKVASMDASAKMCPDLVKSLFSAGLMGIETKAEWGGSELSFFCSILAIEEISRICPAVGGLVDVQNTLLNTILGKWGTPLQQSTLLPRLATKEVAAFCLTEPHSGSDAFALKTRAVKQPDGNGGERWVINGSKCFISNATEATVFLVMATVDPSKGFKGITCFVVDAASLPADGSRGRVTIGKQEKKMGIRASSTCEVIFQDVVPMSIDGAALPNDRLGVIGEVGSGYKIAIEALNEGRIGIGAQMVGLAQGAMDIALPYVLKERQQFGMYVGEFQGMQFQYAAQAMEIHAARLLVYNAARMKLANMPFVTEAAMAKLYSSEVAERTASRAIEWMGGVGFMEGEVPGLAKLYRDAKAGSIYEGTSNIQRLTIAKAMKEQYQRRPPGGATR